MRTHGIGWRAPWATLSLAVVAVASATRLPETWTYARAALPAILAWGSPESQHRLTFSGEAYDFLRVADAVLPPRASLLFVTPGTDVRVLEYTLYHRALYHLTPRAIVWAAPAPRDESWEMRLLHSVPLRSDSLRATATAAGARCLLAWRVDVPPDTGTRLRRFGGGALWALPGAKSEDCLRDPLTPPAPTFVTGPWGLRLAAALIAVLLLGGAVTAAAAKSGAPGGLGTEGLARAWLFGTGVLSLAMAGLAAVGVPLRLQVGALGLAALTAALPAWRRLRIRRATASARALRAPAFDSRSGWPGTLGGTLLAVFLLLQTLFVFGVAAGRPLWAWDAWATWGSKARSIFVEGNVGPAVYADPTRIGTLLTYPLHYPLTEAWIYGWLGAPDDRLAGLVAATSWLALVALVRGAARRWGCSPSVALAAAAVAGAVPFVAGTAAYAYADVPLAALAALLAIALVDRARDPSLQARGLDGTAMLAAALLPWTKREGWILLCSLALAAWLATRTAPESRRMIRAALATGLLIGGAWLAFVFSVGGGMGVGDFALAAERPMAAAVGRIPEILRLEARTLLDPGWALLWPLAAAWGAVAAIRGLRSSRHREMVRRRRGSGLLPLAVAIDLGVLTGAYCLSAHAPLEQHVLTSFFRLAVQITPLVALWWALEAAEERAHVVGAPGSSATASIRGDTIATRRS